MPCLCPVFILFNVLFLSCLCPLAVFLLPKTWIIYLYKYFVWLFFSSLSFISVLNHCKGGHHGRDRMVVGFTTTYAISAHHHWCCDFESRSGRGVEYYVIKFVSDLWQVDVVFFTVLRFPPPIKLTDIDEILSKVTLTTTLNLNHSNHCPLIGK